VLLLVVGSVGLFAPIGVAAVVLERAASGYAEQGAHQRARLGIDLLVNVGTAFPRLSSAMLDHGLSPTEAARLDAAVTLGRRNGLVSGVTLWDRTGLVSYSSAQRLEGKQAVIEPDVRAALAGAEITVSHPHERNLTAAGGMGVLDAFQPLRTPDGEIYGALEMSLPLAPITADAASLSHRIYLFCFGGAFILWLMLLPFARHIARTASAAWVPGRRRTRHAVGHALAQDRIELVYQPQVSPSDGAYVAVEALVRMREGDQLRSPGSFLPHVEGSSLDDPLADRVVDIALAQLVAWRALGYDLRMSINLTSHNLAQRDLPSRIRAAFERHGCDPANVTFEVTETGVLHELGASREVVAELVALGAEISVDDFGTGHSSISRLHRLPVSEVKIDRSFVMPSDARSRAYVASIVGFARGLGLRIVAEGVEDAEALRFLDELGCDLAQGFHIRRPGSAAEIGDWLSAAETRLRQRQPVRARAA
jgi:EAL domain-containing protein (putative c-di-GMP-specific phosphodiesterase class I)